MENKALTEEDLLLTSSILDFWYSKDFDRKTVAPSEVSKIWFNSTPEFDSMVSELFKDTLQKLGDGHFNHWLQDRNGRLAAVLLTD
jgi:uncharacterized protein (DUF924 family)